MTASRVEYLVGLALAALEVGDLQGARNLLAQASAEIGAYQALLPGPRPVPSGGLA